MSYKCKQQGVETDLLPQIIPVLNREQPQKQIYPIANAADGERVPRRSIHGRHDIVP